EGERRGAKARPVHPPARAFKGIKGVAAETDTATIDACQGQTGQDEPTMSRINTNVSSLIAQRVLRKNNDSLGTSLERLSTGLRINKGADDPAGLIASENLRLAKSGIAQAIDNAERHSNINGTSERRPTWISSRPTELQQLMTQSSR